MSKLADLETTAKIKLALITNVHIGGLDIGVDTVNGIVILSGVVQEPDQRDLAEEIARAHGATEVRNDIEVLSESQESAIRQVVGQADSYPPEDVSLSTRILGDLEADGRVNPLTVNVEEEAGIVRLSGYQYSEKARERVEEIARSVQGVRDVINDIEVRTA